MFTESPSYCKRLDIVYTLLRQITIISAGQDGRFKTIVNVDVASFILFNGNI
jgi:hypothetical protein